MANKTALASQNSVFASMMLQLHAQSAEQVTMQKEITQIKNKLDKASKHLVEKDQVIGSLEEDLAHMVDLLGSRGKEPKQWMSRTVPGIAEA